MVNNRRAQLAVKFQETEGTKNSLDWYEWLFCSDGLSDAAMDNDNNEMMNLEINIFSSKWLTIFPMIPI